jgi:hypothetical protein
MSIAVWKEEVSTRIRGRANDVEDRSGTSSFALFAQSIRTLPVDSQGYRDLATALQELMSDYLANENESALQDLSDLVQLGEIRSSQFALMAYQAWSQTAHDGSLRVPLLSLLTSLGRRLTPAELQNGHDVRLRAPAVWVDAWAYSQPLQYWANLVGDLLRGGTLAPQELYARLPSWYQQFGADLLVVVREWLSDVPSNFRETFGRWLSSRLPDTQPQVMAATTPRYRMRILLGSGDTQFLGNAYQGSARKLNGQHPLGYVE